MRGKADALEPGGLPRCLDAIGMPAALLDREQRILEVNRALAALLPADGLEPKGQVLIECLSAAALTTGQSQEKHIFRFRCKEGDRYYRLDLHAPEGRLLAVLMDMTDEQHAIEGLGFTSSTHAQLMEDAQIGVWRFDPDTLMYHFSSSILLGYERTSDVIPFSAIQLIQSKQDAAEDREIVNQLTTSGGSAESERRYRHAEGRWVHLRVHARSGKRLPSGRYELYGVTQNVTPQAAARDEAKAQENRLKVALKAANAAVFEYDYKKKKYWVSEQMVALLGLERVRNASHLPLELFAEDDREAVQSYARRMFQGGELGGVDARMLTLNGVRWVRIFTEVERGADGEARRTIGLLLDIDENKKQEIALEEARKDAEAAASAKSSFLAAMSHEIRTPLNGVLGMAQSLYGDQLTAEQRGKVGIILDSGSTLMALLNDVLDLSKIDAGKMDIVPIDSDLRESTTRIVQLFQPGADDKGVKLTLSIDPALPERLKIDPVRVRQCVSNLLSNAIKFTEPGGLVEVRISAVRQPSGDYSVEMIMSDSGIGMDAETVAKLFSAFTQADGSTSRRFGGSGLGLAISRQLARAMDGEISVESELGKGSRFTLTIVAGAAASEPVNAQNARQPESGTPLAEVPAHTVVAGARVLLVDDNPVNRQVVRLFLAPYSVRIREAANGREALDALRAEQFDLVLLDVHMPVMGGCEAVKAIRASSDRWRDVPVIALTADAMSGDKERFLAIGMTDYVSKPIDQRELISKITAVLASRPAAPVEPIEPLPKRAAAAFTT